MNELRGSVDMSTDEAWSSLRTSTIGRVSGRRMGRATIELVRFVVSGADLVVSAHYLSDRADDYLDSDVTFEVGDIDIVTGAGWSVTVHGIARPDRSVSMAVDGYVVSAPLVRISNLEIEGQRLVPARNVELLQHAPTR